MTGWTPPDLPQGIPLYRAIADAIAADVASGALKPGTRLPTHRALAESMGVDLTTVTRAYAEARARGLVAAAVGRGTFVAEQGDRPPPPPVQLDLSMNLPPQPPGADLAARLARAMAGLTRRPDLASLLNYQPIGGGEADRRAGARWLSAALPDLRAERVLVAGGGQACLTALLSLLASPGSHVMTDAFLYPGFRLAAQSRGLSLLPVEGDAEGMLPDALAAVARHSAAQLLYLTPSIHNPTTRTLSQARREALVKVARSYDLIVIEDDAYGLLAADAPPPLAALAPERVWHVATLAKGLTPALRIAYLVVPQGGDVRAASIALRATSQMAPPLSMAVATSWIEDGTARAILAAIREEAAERQRIAARILPLGSFQAHPNGHHLWLDLTRSWTDKAFVEAARRAGAALVPGSVFAVAGEPPPHARVSLGAAPDRASLTHALDRLAVLLRHGPLPDGEVVV
ncbi:PLP-dependent aminotransferase family protein [Niveispirillum fermenti]|uniref:aminotransferase-like domain-containing protein n=1 Tax=Niveispirillum fermenti TaxID=1233113 RepID=UPI003A8A45D0